jgi:hypothetical protein
MGPFEMVVAIIFIVTAGKIIQTKQKAKHGIVEDRDFMGTKTHRRLNQRGNAADARRDQGAERTYSGTGTHCD